MKRTLLLLAMLTLGLSFQGAAQATPDREHGHGCNKVDSCKPEHKDDEPSPSSPPSPPSPPAPAAPSPEPQPAPVPVPDVSQPEPEYEVIEVEPAESWGK